jgi:hypothetical protein
VGFDIFNWPAGSMVECLTTTSSSEYGKNQVVVGYRTAHSFFYSFSLYSNIVECSYNITTSKASTSQQWLSDEVYFFESRLCVEKKSYKNISMTLF